MGMTTIGSITVGGRDAKSRECRPIGAGVAFWLGGPAPMLFRHRLPDSNWEIEFQKGGRAVVARTTDKMERGPLLTDGLEHVERCLDVLSFEHRRHLAVSSPGEDYLALFVRDGSYVLEHFGVSDVAVGFHMAGRALDQHGDETSRKAAAAAVWIPALRFYRLSQSSDSIVDAYRHLWLGFEALLSGVLRHKPGEYREREWLVEALTRLGGSMDLHGFAPRECTNPVDYIAGTQYDNIRCRLFHAKTMQPLVVPDLPEPGEITSAYERLLRLWRAIAEQIYAVRAGGGGGMTYEGFHLMMDAALGGRLTMQFTEDPSEFTKEDKAVSPLGLPVHEFDRVDYLGATMPGRAGFVGSLQLVEDGDYPEIRRVCSTAGGSLMTVTWLHEGLRLGGIDRFESRHEIRLLNPGLPKRRFAR